MRIHTIILILTVESISFIAHARDILIQIKSEYQKPITLNIGNENYILNPNEKPQVLKYASVNDVIAAGNIAKIKTRETWYEGTWHKGINVGFAKAAAAAKQNPAAVVVQKIIILNTPTHEAHFKYNFEELLIAQPRTSSASSVDYENLLLNDETEEFFDAITNNKIYGSIPALKLKVIRESQYNGTNESRSPLALLEKKINSSLGIGRARNTINKKDIPQKVITAINEIFNAMVMGSSLWQKDEIIFPAHLTKEDLLQFVYQ